jgi:hypothetical protein
LKTSNDIIVFPKIENSSQYLSKSENSTNSNSLLTANTDQKDDIEFVFNDIDQYQLEKIVDQEFVIQFNDLSDTSLNFTDEIIADNEFALDGHIDFETSNNESIKEDIEAEEEPLVIEFEDTLYQNLENNSTSKSAETIEFGTISSISDHENLSNEIQIEFSQTEVAIEEVKATLFKDERYKAKILTALKMRDLNFEFHKISDITGISSEEMQNYEQYIALEAMKESSHETETNNSENDDETATFAEPLNTISNTNQIYEDTYVENNNAIIESKDSIENSSQNTPQSSTKSNDFILDEKDKRPFVSWLEMLSPEKYSDIENNETTKLEKTNPLGIEDNFEFEGQQYTLEESEFNDPIKHYIQEQIETKKTKIHPSKTYKPKSIDSIDFEEIISETLAKLYIKQGHKEKGIRMYDKLILKFPEKSVYFASEIEKLK